MTDDTGLLLIIEDDDALRCALRRSMEERAFKVMEAAEETSAIELLKNTQPQYALVDLHLGSGNGLNVISELKAHRPACRIVVLSAYAHVASVVAAVKAGAFDCLVKPTDPDDIANTLRTPKNGRPELSAHPTDPSEARRRHVLNMLEENNHNVTKTARRLGMHRRTVQRIISAGLPSSS